MSREVNKHGLPRYIPSKTRREIRKDAGYGCVICGCLFIDYEHIEPEYNDCTSHDPKKMTLLCTSCHTRVTRKIISKRKVWEAKNNPKALKDGVVHDMLYSETNDLEIHVGKLQATHTPIILTSDQKPLLWIEPPVNDEEPGKICALFYNENKEPIAYINRNQIVAISGKNDIVSESTSVKIYVNGKLSLHLEREGGEPLKIEKINMSHSQNKVTTNKEGGLEVISHGSTIYLGGAIISHCTSAVSLGDMLKKAITEDQRLQVSISLSSTGVIRGVSGDTVGYQYNGFIIDKRLNVVGFYIRSSAFTLFGEYIGNIVNQRIIHLDEQYETGEPIYISSSSRARNTLSKTRGYDLSFRFFEYPPSYYR